MCRVIRVGRWCSLVVPFLFCRSDQTSAHVARGLHVEEAQVAVSETGDEDGFEGVGHQARTLLLRDHEVRHLFLVEHVPRLHRPVFARGSDYVVLVELV